MYAQSRVVTDEKELTFTTLSITNLGDSQPEMSKLRDGVSAIEMSSLRLVWMKYESYILHAESLRLVWAKYESCILHPSAVMYTFQNLNTAVNDKV